MAESSGDLYGELAQGPAAPAPPGWWTTVTAPLPPPPPDDASGSTQIGDRSEHVGTPLLTPTQTTQAQQALGLTPGGTTGADLSDYLGQLRQARSVLGALDTGEQAEIEAHGARIGAAREATQAAQADYRTALGEARPTPPALAEAPPVPDLKVRPWLDPEGKNALVSIGQWLGMLAVGAAGIKLKAPFTTIKLFRDATEAWRLDETDRANSAWRAFQADIGRVREQNQSALTAFELADKQHGQAVDAKKATAISTLMDMNLEEQALAVARMPYEQARTAIQTQVDLTGKMLTAAEAFEARKAQQENARINLLRLLEQQRSTEEYQKVQLGMEERRFGLEQRRLQEAQTERGERREERLAAPEAGFFIDTSNMKIVTISKGEFQKEPDRYHRIPPGEEQRFNLLGTALTHVEGLRDLLPKVLQKNPAENILRAAELKAKGILAADTDLRKFLNLAEDVNIEMTSALGAGSGGFRIGLLNLLRNSVGVKTSDTIATADAALQTIRTSLENRRLGIAQMPTLKYGTVVGPGTWLGTDDQGRHVTYSLGPGERLPDKWTAEDLVSIP